MAITVASAVFTGAQDFVDVAVANQGGTNYGILTGVETADGPVVITCPPANKTATNVRVEASGRFTGTVNLTLYPR